MNPANAGMARWGSVVASAVIGSGILLALGCGGAPKDAAAPSKPAGTSPTALESADSGAGTATTTAAGTAGPASADSATSAPAGAASASSTPGTPPTPAPPAHPFANSPDEATSLIDDAITSRANELGACVDAARARRKTPHAKLVLEVGIDEEGHMLGVKLPKGEKPDKAFVDCVLASLRGAPFPKSHAGVITVRKTFEDKAVYR